MDQENHHMGGSPEADHLCVLVHGLWGNPNHMVSIAKSLRAQYPAEKLHLLLAKRNSGSFTYDGIERGGERVCAEIEEELRLINKNGGKITKLSIVGYSLGGLVARYAVGLLYAKGMLDKFECMNFTTFATPHLGVRSPLRGWHNTVWNVMGARTLSESGQQLFTVDNFRDTGRPLLSVLAEPDSIFMSGLRRFRRHTLYSNIVNDKSAVYYTTCITKTDPYVNIENINVNFLPGYENIILDPANPVNPRPKPPVSLTLSETATKWVRRIPFLLAVAVFVPIGVIGYLLNSVVQNFRSSKRITLHEKGLAGVSIDDYRGFSLWIKEIRTEVEQAYEALNNTQRQEFLASASDVEEADGRDVDENSESDEADDSAEASTRLLARERRLSIPTQPTLALDPHQFRMIQSLDKVGWRKYPVWIHKVRHSHAAMIVRWENEAFSEGKIVLRHWLTEEFLT